jgi:nitrite reductase (NADH) small subunit
MSAASKATTFWKNVGPLNQTPRQGARRLCLKHAGRPVAIFRTSADEVFAVVDECPHKKGPLSEGIVAGRTVTCPLHNWVIDLAEGEAVKPDEGRVILLSTRIINGDVFVCVPETAAGAA